MLLLLLQHIQLLPHIEDSLLGNILPLRRRGAEKQAPHPEVVGGRLFGKLTSL